MKSLTKKELSEELQHVYKQLADIKEDYRKSIETNSMIMKVLKEREDIIDRINKEIERLNNIINEYTKWLNEQVDYMTHHSIERMVAFDCCRHKLQELKGSDKD